MRSFFNTINDFEPLDIGERNALRDFCTKGKVLMLKKGEDLFQATGKRDVMVNIDSGLLRQYVTDSHENEKIIHLFQEGDIVDNCSTTTDQTVIEFSVAALEDSMLTIFSQDDIMGICMEFPVFMKIGGMITTQLVQSHNEHTALLMKYTPEQRYQYILERKPELLQRLSVTHLAQYLDISRETLSRIRSRRLEGSLL
jgi:CRP-like cAMP-binding protein